MTYFQLIGASLGCLVVILFLREANSDYAVYVSLFASVLLTGGAVRFMAPAVEYAFESLALTDFSGQASVIMRVTAIGIMTGAACDLCEDAKEKSLGSRISLIGRGAIALTVMPTLAATFDAVRDFLM